MQRNGEVKPDTVGPAADGVELKFTPQREILVRSPGLFKEYHRDPQTTAQARMPKAGFTPATPAIWAMTGICASSTA